MCVDAPKACINNASPKGTAVSRTVDDVFPEKWSANDVHHQARSGRNVIIGPMPVRVFLNEFMPPVPEGMPVPKAEWTFTSEPCHAKDEKTLSGSLVRTPLLPAPSCATELTFNQTKALESSRSCPSVSFRCGADAHVDSALPDLGPVIYGYSENKEDVRVMARRRERLHMGLTELFFVVKMDHDPFCDSHSHAESEYRSFFAFENREYEEVGDVESGRREKWTLGHCIGLAVEACLRQHRVFYFSVLVVCSRVRLFRWDRAGAIVTRAFDIRDEPELLCEFLWRFHLADPVQRGFDPSVSAASKAEEVLFKRLIRKHVAFQLGISENRAARIKYGLPQHFEKGKVIKMEVYEQGHSTPDIFLVSVPLTCPTSVSGHSTRAYWSVKLTGLNKGTVCFLKDTWRLDTGTMKSEGSIYEEMEGMKVENVCDLECYSDLPDFSLMNKAFEVCLQRYVWSH